MTSIWQTIVRGRCQSVVAVVLLGLANGPVRAADVVVRRDQPNLSGAVTATSRDGVTLERRGEKIEVPANAIESITFEGEPPTLQLGRGAERTGNLSVALRRYEEAATASDKARPIVQSDLEFFLARCRARLALADPGELARAAELLEAYRSSHLTSYHYYPLHEWLGKVYARQGDRAKATAAFDELAKAPWKDLQWRADVGQGRLLLDAGDYAAALERFNRVLAESGESSAEKLLQQEALLAKAECLAAQGSYAEAETLLLGIIDNTPAEEASVQAAAHNALGDSMRAAGRPKDALLAYLYVDLLVASEQQEHAKALYYLGELFNQIGEPARAAEAWERLRATYPNSAWAKK